MCGNASAAYRNVYNASGMTDEAVHVSASRVKAKVWLRIQELQEVEAEKYSMSRAEIIRQWMQIATADVNDIIQLRRRSCSCCYEHEVRLQPNLECRKCCGEGESYIYIADSRLLTGGARLLFAGARKTKDSVEVLLRDQEAALINNRESSWYVWKN